MFLLDHAQSPYIYLLRPLDFLLLETAVQLLCISLCKYPVFSTRILYKVDNGWVRDKRRYEEDTFYMTAADRKRFSSATDQTYNRSTGMLVCLGVYLTAHPKMHYFIVPTVQ